MSILRLRCCMLAAVLTSLPLSAYAVGAAGNTDWPTNARVQLRLTLNATRGGDGHLILKGDLVVSNSSDVPLTIQDATNRLVLAFLVFDALGNPVAPKGVGKTDPDFAT